MRFGLAVERAANGLCKGAGRRTSKAVTLEVRSPGDSIAAIATHARAHWVTSLAHAPGAARLTSNPFFAKDLPCQRVDGLSVETGSNWVHIGTVRYGPQSIEGCCDRRTSSGLKAWRTGCERIRWRNSRPSSRRRQAQVRPPPAVDRRPFQSARAARRLFQSARAPRRPSQSARASRRPSQLAQGPRLRQRLPRALLIERTTSFATGAGISHWRGPTGSITF